MCDYIDSKVIAPGYKCCHCNVYNGMQRSECRDCQKAHCETLNPDNTTGKVFHTRIYHFPTLGEVRRQDDKREDVYGKTIQLLTTFSQGFERGDRFFDRRGVELHSVLEVMQALQYGEIQIKEVGKE